MTGHRLALVPLRVPTIYHHLPCQLYERWFRVFVQSIRSLCPDRPFNPTWWTRLSLPPSRRCGAWHAGYYGCYSDQM